MLLLLLINSIALSEESSASQLQFGEPMREGAYFTVPIYLQDNSAEVAAMDFRLQYDPQVFTPVSTEAGGVAVAAGKVVSANQTQPGEYTVVLMGLNRDTLGSGEVARIVLESGNPDFNDASRLTIADPTLATWEGQEIPSHGESRWMEMGAQNGEAPAEEEEPQPADDADPQEDPQSPGFLPQDPDTGTAPTADLTAPTPLAGLPGSNAALDPSGERHPDDLRRMTENIARNAAEAIRLREQLPTPGAPDAAEEHTASSGEASDTHLAQQSPQHNNLSGDAALSGSGPEATAPREVEDAPPTDANLEDDATTEANTARQRAVSSLQWLVIAGVAVLLLLGLGVMRRHFLD